MYQKNDSFNTFIGVDVSKLHLDIFVGETATHHRIENTLRSINSWLKKHSTLGACIVFEATGGYEKRWGWRRLAGVLMYENEYNTL